MNQDDPTPPPLPERPTLEYRHSAPGNDPPFQPRTPMWAQVFAGFGAWIIGIATVIIAATSGHSPSAMAGNPVVLVIGALLVCLGGITIWLRLRFRWRGFLPGLLIGFALTCLVPAGIVAVICGMGK